MFKNPHFLKASKYKHPTDRGTWEGNGVNLGIYPSLSWIFGKD
jgi:hypothetical protein